MKNFKAPCLQVKNNDLQRFAETRVFYKHRCIIFGGASVTGVGSSDTRTCVSSKKFHPSRYFVSESAINRKEEQELGTYIAIIHSRDRNQRSWITISTVFHCDLCTGDVKLRFVSDVIGDVLDAHEIPRVIGFGLATTQSNTHSPLRRFFGMVKGMRVIATENND